MTSGAFPNQVERDPARPWAPGPFTRLARVHAASVAGDANFNIALAGLVFLSVTDLNQARWRVAAALVFTVLPFALAAPFIGPLIDRARGGRKWMIVALSALRAVVCVLLILVRDSTLVLYPLFLLALVFQKGYVIAKGAVVPTTVNSDEELVAANSKLSALSGLAAIGGGVPALAVMWIVGKLAEGRGPDGALVVGGVVYVVATILAFQLPNARIAAQPAGEAEEEELQGVGIRHASVALALMRGSVGFLTFMLAFHFKDIDSKVGFAGSVVGGQAGFLVGAFLAPRLRRLLAEEQILMLALGVIATAGLLTAAMNEIAGATLIAFGVGLSTNTARQAFDALVQRDAPDANRGRAFGRFETRFQLIWVTGGLIPTAFVLPIKAGFIAIAVAAAGVLVWYYQSLRRIRDAARRRPSPLDAEPVLVEPRPPSRSFLRGRREQGGVALVTAPVAGEPILGLADDPTVVDAPPAGVGVGDDPTEVHLGTGWAEHVPAPPGTPEWTPEPPPPPTPSLYDGAGDLDDRPADTVGAVDQGASGDPPPPPRWRSGAVATPVGARPDPGPPSLVRPEPTFQGWAPPEAPVHPPAPVAAPPVHADVAEPDGPRPDGLQLTAADGTIAEPVWRDSDDDGTPPLPGFEHLAGDPPTGAPS